MRVLVRTLMLEALPASPSQIPEDRWYGSGGIIDTPAKPFAELRFGGRFRGMGGIVRRRLEVWVHSEEGDYEPIEAELAFIKSVLDGVEHRSDEQGNEIITCSWVNDSTDLYDDGYRTFCMSSTYEIVGKDGSAS